MNNENTALRIPNKILDAIYVIYYNYEKDEKGRFSYFIGCKVQNNIEKPKGLDEICIPDQSYDRVTVKGQIPHCIREALEQIWQEKKQRKFEFDFEVYDERSANWDKAEIEIYISVSTEE